MFLSPLAAFLAASLSAPLAAPAEPAARAPDVAPFVSVDAKVIALAHVRVIDGTGGPAREDQTVVIQGDSLHSIGPAATERLSTPSFRQLGAPRDPSPLGRLPCPVQTHGSPRPFGCETDHAWVARGSVARVTSGRIQ